MRKVLFVLFILGFLAGNTMAAPQTESRRAAADGIMVSAGTGGDTVTVNIVKDGLFFECLFSAKGEMASLRIGMKDAPRRGDRIEYEIYFSEGAARSIHYSFYGADNDYQGESYKCDKGTDPVRSSPAGRDATFNGAHKKLCGLAEKFAAKLSNDHNLPKLVREAAARKRAEIKQLEEEQKRQEAKKAKLRPDPAKTLEKILKGK